MAEIDTRKHAKFAKNFCDYATEYGFTDRAIRRWVRVGKQLGDVPPLDAPADMASWWARCMKHRVPEELLRFSSATESSTTPAAPRQSTSPGEASPTPELRDFSNVRGLDLAENVEALRRTHAINKQLLDEALEGVNENLVTLRQKNFERSFDLLRKAEQTLIDIQKQRGKMIARDDVETELAQVLESLRVMREAMPRRILAELEKVMPRRLARVFAIIERLLTPAIDKVRLAEDEILLDLSSLNGSADLRALLAA